MPDRLRSRATLGKRMRYALPPCPKGCGPAKERVVQSTPSLWLQASRPQGGADLLRIPPPPRRRDAYGHNNLGSSFRNGVGACRNLGAREYARLHSPPPAHRPSALG